jgi:hypothetical protein
MTKYHNIPTEVDGIKFASRKESKRYRELKLLERAGEIWALKLQPSFDFPLTAENLRGPQEYLRYLSGRKVKYIADFKYSEFQKTNPPSKILAVVIVVEDVKGIQTPVFKLKAALMKAVHGIEVRIT